MKKRIERILARWGYIPRTGFHETLRELVVESCRRDGEMIETDIQGMRIKIAAKDFFR